MTAEPVRKRENMLMKSEGDRKRRKNPNMKTIQLVTLYIKTKDFKSNYLIRKYLRGIKLLNSFGEENKKSSNKINRTFKISRI